MTTPAIVVLLSIAAAIASAKKPLPLEPIPVVTPTPVVVSSVKGAHFEPLNYTGPQKAVLLVAENLTNELLQSQCFDSFMTKRALIQTEGKTNAQVIQNLKTTNLTVPVEMYYSRKNVVGYRNVGSPTVHTNSRFHEGSTACARGSNITHEWSHVVGYGHDYKATRQRPYSVPYSINAAFEACCKCAPKSIVDCTIVQ